MSCFLLNKTTGLEALEFADDLEITVRIRNVYFYLNTCLSFLSMLFNALICVVIIRNPNSLIKIIPMLLANSIIDFLFAASFFVFGRYLFVGYQYIFIIYMGFVKVENATLMYVTDFAEFTLSIASWIMTVSQIVYRFLLVKNNEQPHLWCFATFFLLLMVLHLLANVDINPNEHSDEHLQRSKRIFQYYGFDIQSSHYVIKPDESNKFSKLSSTLLITFESLLIIYCAVQIRRLLHRSTAMKSATTRRLNQSMDRTIFAMSIVPIILNIIITLTSSIFINRCQSNAVFSLFLLTIFLFASSLNACLSITFIRFYRDAFLKLITFGLYEKPKRIKKVLPLHLQQPRYQYFH